MKLFECRPSLHGYAGLEAFLGDMGVGRGDLILTHRALLEDERLANGAQVLYQEACGEGEPTCAMLLSLLNAAKRPYRRVLGIGGGTVLDLAKLLSLDYAPCESDDTVLRLFDGSRAARKACPVVLAPTTCGTGSEVTAVAVLLFERLNVKLGMADAALYAQAAALIPSLLHTLPYKPFALSAIDALIHACESFVSPRATRITRLFSANALRQALGVLAASPARKPDADGLAALLEASTLAGIAFDNAGCGAVHALSYPIGGLCHLPHGEANYLVFLPVLRFYEARAERAPLEALKAVLGDAMNCPPGRAFDALEALLGRLYPRRTLAQAGVTGAMLPQMAKDVAARQQRLLSTAMCALTERDLLAIYQQA